MAKILWILGAADPEMEAIERLLQENGQEVGYALDAAGQRVRPGNAYQAYSWGGIGIDALHVVLVECGFVDARAAHLREHADTVKVIDHHRPGDPGYGLPPEDFLHGSSIGQVCHFLAERMSLPWPSEEGFGSASGQDLGVGACIDFSGDRWEVSVTESDRETVYDIPHDIVMGAAADHCLAHAYAGRCPGVDPDALMRWRAASRATFQRRLVADVEADIAKARLALAAAPRIDIAGIPVADMGDAHVPELPEASARDGVPFLATGIPDPDGRRKTVLQSAPPQVIRAWMDAHPGSYGDPARGFAGREWEGEE